MEAAMNVYRVLVSFNGGSSYRFLVQAKTCADAARKVAVHARKTADPGKRIEVVSVESLGELDIR